MLEFEKKRKLSCVSPRMLGDLFGFFFLQGCLVALDVFKGMLHCLWVFLEGCLVVLEGCLVVLDFFKGMLGGCFRFFRGILDCFGSF